MLVLTVLVLDTTIQADNASSQVMKPDLVLQELFMMACKLVCRLQILYTYCSSPMTSKRLQDIAALLLASCGITKQLTGKEATAISFGSETEGFRAKFIHSQVRQACQCDLSKAEATVMQLTWLCSSAECRAGFLLAQNCIGWHKCISCFSRQSAMQ